MHRFRPWRSEFPAGGVARLLPNSDAKRAVMKTWTWVFWATLLLGGIFETRSSAQETVSLQTVRAERDSGDFESAFGHLIELSKTSKQDLSLDLVLLARKAKTRLPATQITQLYRAAVESSFNGRAENGNLDVRLLVRLAAAEHFVTTGQRTLSVRPILAALDDLEQVHSSTQSPRRKAVVLFALRTAASELSDGHEKAAERLYQSVRKVTQNATNGELHAKATLGLGWTLASDETRLAEAAELLGAFVRDHADHPDAPRALAQAIRCLHASDNTTLAIKATTQFLERWPKDPSTAELIDAAIRHPTASQTPIRAACIEWMKQVNPGDWPPKMVAHVIGESLDANQFDPAARRLAKSDTNGQHVADALNRLTNDGQDSSAERLAAAILAANSNDCQPMARESVCRWAGRTSRWSMLALHASSVQPNENPSCTPHTERLYAEALHRQGDSETAYQWWVHLVDVRGADDFATRLRLAECSVSKASVADATQRIEQARSVAKDSNGRSLLNFLEADLAIRRLQFDAARDLYEAIIRDAAAEVQLRGRAQWMIGETHLMQRQFAKAIDAYRRVEGLAPGSPFVPTSLLQAGKSFEQLGRTREAAVCYGALLSRYAASRHASVARQRLAKLPVADEETQSIRR